MAETTMWRYLDPAGNEHGPYSTEELRQHLQDGRIDRAGQVWREGMTAWASLDSVASELGLVRQGGPRVVVRAPAGKSGMSGCAIAAIVVVGGVLVFGGIFAAIAVAQYQDYVVRAQVSEAPMLADGVKIPVAEYYNNTQQWPAGNEAAGLAEPGEIRGTYVSAMEVAGDGRIIASFSSQPPNSAHATLEGATLVFTPTANADTSVHWQCSSDSIAQKHCPSSCQCSK